MPKQKSPKLAIHLDLLKPQSNPEKLLIKFLRWLLSTGRFIFVFVEALVLIVFISRFKLDEDLTSKKDAIEKQIPYIESLKQFEILTRQTQLKLTTISSFRKNPIDYPEVLKSIANQTPSGVKVISIKLEKSTTSVVVQLNGVTSSNSDLATFVSGLKQDPLFSDVNLTSIGFDKGILNFSIKTQVNLYRKGDNS